MHGHVALGRGSPVGSDSNHFRGDAAADGTDLLSKTAEEYRDNGAALTRLQAGLGGLAKTATSLARQDATEIVARFGQMGARKFTLAA